MVKILFKDSSEASVNPYYQGILPKINLNFIKNYNINLRRPIGSIFYEGR